MPEPPPQPNFMSDPDAVLTALLQAEQTITMTAHGQSMYPIIRNGDTLQVAPIAADALAIGDIVFCRLLTPDNNDRILIHRLIVRLSDGSLLTRGDNCGRADPPLFPATILGRVQRINRTDQTRLLSRIVNRVCGQLSGWQLAFDRRYQQAAHNHRPARYLWRLARQTTTGSFLLALWSARLLIRR